MAKKDTLYSFRHTGVFNNHYNVDTVVKNSMRDNVTVHAV